MTTINNTNLDKSGDKSGATVYLEAELLSVTLADIYLNVAKYCIWEEIYKGISSIKNLERKTKIPKDELIDLIKELIHKQIINIKFNRLYTSHKPPKRKCDTLKVLRMIKLRNRELSYTEISKEVKISRKEVAEILTNLLNQKDIPEKTQKAFSRKQQVESIHKKKNEKSKSKHHNKEFYPIS